MASADDKSPDGDENIDETHVPPVPETYRPRVSLA